MQVDLYYELLPTGWLSCARTRLIANAKILFLFISALFFSGEGFCQGGDITISAQGISLENAFSLIEQQSGYSFFYKYNEVHEARPVTIRVQNATLEQALIECLKNQPFSYSIEDKTIVIAQVPAGEMRKAPVLVQGHVTAQEDGASIAGLNVVLKGTTTGTATDGEGNYQLSIPAEGAILIFSSIGYVTEEIPVGSQTVINVEMVQDLKTLSEVVVIAYGTTTKRYNTGSIAKIEAKDIERQPVPNVLQSLQGMVPGLEVTQSNGNPSSVVKLQIRGRKDLFNAGANNVSTPLYVLDGVPLATSSGDFNGVGLNQNGFMGANGGQSPLYSINPSDIESIEVLKDADATAIYGSRGANGVIMITTKKGAAQTSHFEINAYTGFKTALRQVDLLNTQQYLAMRREAFKNDGIIPDVSNAPDLLVWDTTRYTNWQKELANTARTYDVQMNYSGGNALTYFRFSGGYHSETPPIPQGFANTFKDQRISSQLTLSHASQNQRFKSTLLLNYANTSNSLAGGELSQYTLPPNAPPILDAQGKLNWAEWGTLFPNAFTTLYQPYKSKTNNLISNLSLNYAPFQGLVVTGSMGYTNTRMDQVQLVPASAQNPAYNPSSASQFGLNSFRSWVVEPYAAYTRPMGKGILQVTAGGTLQEDITEDNVVTAYGFSNDALLENMSSASSLYAASNYKQYRYQGYFVRVNYNWDGKYVLNVSGRRDGSSRFKTGRQLANFGAVGAAWIFSEEKWLKDHLRFLSFGKWRGSYGLTGSASSADYQYFTKWYSPGNGYDGINALLLLNPANTDFRWQENKKLETALELGFLRDRITLSVAWYRENCGNQLVNYPLPTFTGFSGVTANLPALIRNQGWEVILTSRNVVGGTFDWSTTFNISFNQNKLVSYPGLENSVDKDQYLLGQPTTIQKLLHFTGVDPTTGEYQFQDVNGDGTITRYTTSQGDDNVGMHNTSPKFLGGILNTLQYRGWQLSFLLDFKKQRGYNVVAQGVAGSMENQPVAVLERWQKDGDVSNIAKFSTTYRGDLLNYTGSDATLVDASYVRLQNLALSYQLPSSWIKYAKLSSCRIYFQGQNLLTLTSFKGNDPTNAATANAYLFPVQRYFTGGIQLSF